MASCISRLYQIATASKQRVILYIKVIVLQLLQHLYQNSYITNNGNVAIIITMVHIFHNGFIQWLYHYGFIAVIITVVCFTNQLLDGGVDLKEHGGALVMNHRHIVTTRRSTSIPVRGVPKICVGQPPLVRTVNQT